MKESRILYHEWYPLIQFLPDEKRILFYDSFFSGKYEIDTDDPHLLSIWNFVIQKVKDNEEKYEKKVKQLRANASKPRSKTSKSNQIDSDNVNDNVNDKKADSPAVDEQPAEPPPDDPVFMTFDCSGEPKEWDLKQSQVEKWKELYPDLDVEYECRKAWNYNDSNPKKTFGGMKRFLTSWLNRATNNRSGVKKRDGPQNNRHWDAGAKLRELNERDELW